MLLNSLIDLIIDNRGKNPPYYTNEGIAVIDNSLITNNYYPDISKIKRYIDEQTYNNFIRCKTQKDDVLITLVGNGYGNVSLSPLKTIIIQNTIGLRCNETCLQKYLYYLLLKNNEKIKQLNRGAAQPSVKVSDLLNIELSVHDIPMQRHIVDTIGSIDDLIEKYEGINDFIYNYLHSHYSKLPFSKGLKVSDIFECINGGTFKSSEYVDYSQNKLITIKNINSKGFSTNDVTYISDSHKNDKYLLKVGDILLTMTGAYLGRSGIVDENNCYQNQRVLKINSSHSAFLYCFLKANENNIFLLGKGSAQPNLSLLDFKNFPINFSYNDIESFDRYNLFIDYMIQNKVIIKKYKNLKQLYLKKFFG